MRAEAENAEYLSELVRIIWPEHALEELTSILKQYIASENSAVFAETENALRYTTHPRVVFETAAVKAARPETDYDIDALLARIKALEDKVAQGVQIRVDDSVKKSEPERKKPQELPPIPDMQGSL